ncbi:hypothetical protein MRX96_019607 [Rhipicephalus microplus]
MAPIEIILSLHWDAAIVLHPAAPIERRFAFFVERLSETTTPLAAAAALSLTIFKILLALSFMTLSVEYDIESIWLCLTCMCVCGCVGVYAFLMSKLNACTILS